MNVPNTDRPGEFPISRCVLSVALGSALLAGFGDPLFAQCAGRAGGMRPSAGGPAGGTGFGNITGFGNTTDGRAGGMNAMQAMQMVQRLQVLQQAQTQRLFLMRQQVIAARERQLAQQAVARQQQLDQNARGTKSKSSSEQRPRSRRERYLAERRRRDAERNRERLERAARGRRAGRVNQTLLASGPG